MGFTTIQKIGNSLWVLFSFIMFFTGVGFLIIGFRVNEIKWIISGIIYEIPWVLCFCFIDTSLEDPVMILVVIFWFIAIIHSFLTITRFLKKLEAKTFGVNPVTYNSAITSDVPNNLGNIQNRHNNVEGVNSNLNGNRTIDFDFKPEDVPIKPININTASEEELSSIPGFNLIIAKRIIELRKVHKFSSAEELGNELNLKPHIINNLRKYASFEDNSQFIKMGDLKDTTLDEDLNQVDELTNVNNSELDDINNSNKGPNSNSNNNPKFNKKGRKLDF